MVIVDYSYYLAEFIKELAKKPKLMQEFDNAANKGTKEAYKFALAHSNGQFKEEEFKEYMVNLAKECVASKLIILKDGSLKNVSGGLIPPEYLSQSREFEEKLKEDNKNEKKKIKWIKATGDIAKLTSTLTNIGFSIYEHFKRKNPELEEIKKNNIKKDELKEMIAIKRLEKELKEMGINDYKTILE